MFVPSKRDNRTLMYRFDETTGALAPNSPASVPSGARPAPGFHRTGKFAYVLTEGGRTICSTATTRRLAC